MKSMGQRTMVADGDRDFRYIAGADGTATVTGWSGAGEVCVVPEELDGMPVRAVGDGAFRDNGTLRRVVLPDELIRLGDSAFENCVNLEEVLFSEETETIGKRAFAGCCSLAALRLPADLSELGAEAFADCVSLKAVGLPAGLKEIGGAAFENCISLPVLTVPAGLCRWADNPFAGYPGRLAASLDHPHLKWDGDVLYDRAGETLVHCPPGRDETRYSAPEGVRRILGRAFSGAERLRAVHLPDTVESIGPRAFENCEALRMVRMPETLKQLGEDAFAGCTMLRTAGRPEDMEGCAQEIFSDCCRHLFGKCEIRE